MSETKQLPRVSYFGPAHTNTHVAAKRHFGAAAIYEAELTKTAVFDAVESGRADKGIVPVENSTEGIVRETIDCLITRSPIIESEFDMEIRHCLLASEASQGAPPQKILSHPQPLAQCRHWLDRNYPGVPRQSVASTATAAQTAATESGVYAIATQLAAEHYKLSILHHNIADRNDNATRFLCLSKNDHAPTGMDKTGIVFSATHEQGALLRVLAIFNDAGINMLRIESRPLPGRLWEYAFVVDVEGHRLALPLAPVLERLQLDGRLIKVFGSYPRQVAPAPTHS
jgi:chorismate mutase/prephenate dehydratase